LAGGPPPHCDNIDEQDRKVDDILKLGRLSQGSSEKYAFKNRGRYDVALSLNRLLGLPQTSRSTGLSLSQTSLDLTHSSSSWRGDLLGKTASLMKSA